MGIVITAVEISHVNTSSRSVLCLFGFFIKPGRQPNQEIIDTSSNMKTSKKLFFFFLDTVV